MARVTRVLFLEDGLEICIAGDERRWQIASYSVRLSSPEGENGALIPPSAVLGRKRFHTTEDLVAALRHEIELHGEPLPAVRGWGRSPLAIPTPARRAKRA